MDSESVFTELAHETINIVLSIAKVLPFLAALIVIILACQAIWHMVRKGVSVGDSYNSLKTVTFGDESTVVSNKSASVISVLLIFVLWGSFTGSKLLPEFLHVPGPFMGSGEFTYTSDNGAGDTDKATVSIQVHAAGEKGKKPTVASGDGFALNDALVIQAYRSKLLAWDHNDTAKRKTGAKIIKVNDTSVDLLIQARRYSTYNGSEKLVCSTIMTFVRVDGDGEPVPLSSEIKEKYRSIS